jgi:hypothetical protein
MATDHGQPATAVTTPVKVQSAKPISKLSDEERRQRYAELRERMGRSRLEVSGRPGKHYLWADINHREQIALLEALEYTTAIVDPKHPDITAAGMREDGTFVVGDCILMEVDSDIFDFIMLDNDEKARSLIYDAKDQFKQKAREVGSPTFEFDKPVRV